MVEKKKNKKDLKKIKDHNPSDYIETKPTMSEALKKTVVITFGRFNPITVGHEKLINKVITEAVKRKADAAVYMSHSQDSKKNPMSYNQKISLGQKAFGGIVKKSPAKTIIEVAKELSKKYNNFVLVVGSDRVKEFEVLLKKYNELDYTFENIEIVSAGERDPDSDGVSGMSASKMRQSAAKGNIVSFKQGLPKKLKISAVPIMNMVRKGMNITEELEEQNLSEREPLSIQQRRKKALVMRKYKTKIKMARERSKRKMAPKEKLLKRSRKAALNFMKDRLSKNKKYSQMSTAEKITLDRRLQKIPGKTIDRIASRLLPKVRAAEKERLAGVLNPKKNEDVYDINNMFELFLESKSIKPQDPDVKDMPGSQPKGYYKGVEKDKKDDRARHFAKYGKMDDDNPDAYKPAPGDKEAKTKPSVHTKKFKDMFGEAIHADIPIRKRPHMALEKNGSVKFDKRFKIFKPKEDTVSETYEDFDEDISKLISGMGDFIMSEEFDVLMESNPNAALKKKAEKTGISYGILKTVFDRGVAAWRTGHRPGTNPTQWGFARVNSFATKGKGTWGKADKDLADKVRKEQFDLATGQEQLLNLDEQIMLNKILEKIHNHILNGEKLKDVIEEIETLANIGIPGRRLETEYFKKYNNEHADLTQNEDTESLLKRNQLLKKYGYKVEAKDEKDSPSKREYGTDALTKKYKEDTPGQEIEEAALNANIHRGDVIKFMHTYVTGEKDELEGTLVGTDSETGRAKIRTEDGKLYIVKHDEII